MGEAPADLALDRYSLHEEIASGGMATVYLGRLEGPVGFSRTVAIKRMHPQFARDADFVTMFRDEATLTARIQHPNVVSTLDVVIRDREVVIVMEYIDGAPLSTLLRAGKGERVGIALPVAVSVMTGVLSGLHAAHEATSESGKPLNIVHRDVSPHNVLVGVDGMARLADFGVAKAAIRAGITKDKELKGKVSYMAPEQILGEPVDRRADLFAAGAVLWEMLCGERLFGGDDVGNVVQKILSVQVPPLSSHGTPIPEAIEAILQRALTRDPAHRFATAQHFADELENAVPNIATARTVGAWVRARAAEAIEKGEERVARMQSASGTRPSAVVGAQVRAQGSGARPLAVHEGEAAASPSPGSVDGHGPDDLAAIAPAEASGPPTAEPQAPLPAGSAPSQQWAPAAGSPATSGSSPSVPSGSLPQPLGASGSLPSGSLAGSIAMAQPDRGRWGTIAAVVAAFAVVLLIGAAFAVLSKPTGLPAEPPAQSAATEPGQTAGDALETPAADDEPAAPADQAADAEAAASATASTSAPAVRRPRPRRPRPKPTKDPTYVPDMP